MAEKKVAPKQEENQSLLIVITHLLGIFTGFIGALIVMLVAGDQQVKSHAKKALNWQLSILIYNIVAVILLIILIGFLLLPILAVMNLIFCIIAAVKGSNGELWDYPLSIPFFKTE